MHPLSWLIYILIGCVAGFLGGLLGIGGGLVTVPSLLWVFKSQLREEAHIMQVAIGTSLGAMVFTAGVSTYSHILQKGVRWRLFRGLTPGIFIGALLSACIAHTLSTKVLQNIFGTCEILLGIYFAFFQQKEQEITGLKIPKFFVLSTLGFGIGAISVLLGIGGGLITVPILVALKTPMRNAIATSAATGFLIALVGTISFLFLGFKEVTFEGVTGYLYIPAFLLIGISSIIVVPFAVRLTYKWPTGVLRRIFGIILIIAGISMLIK